MQKEITSIRPLLNEDGSLYQAGFARKLLPVYNKKTDFVSRFKTKEWDYYYVGNDHIGLALTIDDNGYMGLDSISFLNFDEKWEVTISKMQALTLGKKNLPPTSDIGSVAVSGKDYEIKFTHMGEKRWLSGHMDNFKNGKPITFDVILSEFPQESMVIVTPFDKPKHFYYNQKINCMKAIGKVNVDDREYLFGDENSYGTLDWGRGIWTYENTWYWSSLSTTIDGVPFGFNLGYGFGDTSAASENMLFHKGKAHKLEQVEFHIPTKMGKDSFLSDWTFTSSDNRVNLTFKPILDRAACTDALVIISDQHQVFGRFYGTCVLDDGTEIKLDGPVGFAEKVHNRW